MVKVRERLNKCELFVVKSGREALCHSLAPDRNSGPIGSSVDQC